MKVSDYIVSFLISKQITDVFGYPGGMVTHLMDSFDKYNEKISAHVNYHEQASAFCACSYAQTAHHPGVAYATSGPGATNLITGIANAYFDSIPTIFLTGQVNTYESKGELLARQIGFQETDIVSIVKTITKYAVQITDPLQIVYELEKAYFISMDGRPGPVVLDIPMNIQRAEIEISKQTCFQNPIQKEIDYSIIAEKIIETLNHAEKPVIIAGAGISQSGTRDVFEQIVNQLRIPVVTSMIGIDCLPSDNPYKLGFIGAYGQRYANLCVAKSDCIVSLGSRLDGRQTSFNKDNFAPRAVLIRVDIDKDEMTNQIKPDELDFCCDLKQLLPILNQMISCYLQKHPLFKTDSMWIDHCTSLKTQLAPIDLQPANQIMQRLSDLIPEDVICTTDVGQNQVWTSQSFKIKNGQQMLFSGGHGAMGYALPAAIGAYYGSKKPVVCITGDGGLQMNMQELQFIVREKIPIKIVLFNNHSLGMIRHFQEMYFESSFIQTMADGGYTIPDFEKIFYAYGIPSYQVKTPFELEELASILQNPQPAFIHILLDNKTYVYPKLSMGHPIYDQDPLLERTLFHSLLSQNPASYTSI